MKHCCTLILLAVAHLDGCSSINAPRTANPAPLAIEASVAKSKDERKTLGSAVLETRFAALQEIIEAPTFKTLPADAQYNDFLTAGKLAIELGQQRRGYDLIARAAAMPQADFYDRVLLIQTAVTLRLNSDAVSGMEAIIQRWPEQFDDLPNGLLDRVLRASSSLPHNERLSLLRSLYAVHWKLKGDLEPSGVWRDLALLLVEQGLLSEAIDVSTHVSDLYVLVGMKADRRFDAIVAAHPAQFDIDGAAERQLHDLESASDAAPRSLEIKSRVIYALFQQQHYAAMLAETDSVLLAIRSTNFPAKLYADYHSQYKWFLNLRSYALARNGRWDEAAAELAAASAGSIDQLINLGGLYCRMGQPKDALAAIARVGTDVSPYGAMQLEAVRIDAAVQLGDKAQVTRSMQYISAHSADAPGAYMRALLSTRQLKRLGKLLVAQILDPEERQDTLTSVQDYAAVPGTPWEIDNAAQWRQAISRKEVQAAVHKVGRIENYHLEQP